MSHGNKNFFNDVSDFFLGKKQESSTNLTQSTQKATPYNNENLMKDLDKASQARKELASLLGQIQDMLTEAESFSSNASGKLGLDKDIDALSGEIKKLNEGIFRLLVLGEMKRGKSTFLNVLLGEKDLLPTAVTRCTAILTVVRYGEQKKVTVYFNDGKQPAILDFNKFKECYTIKPDEATRLEEQNKKAFPDVDHAVVEYPLEILSKGVEIVDSPGLNDTKDRDKITLNYIAKCHAVLYVLSAMEQFNQNERHYLRSRIKPYGLAVFFLINRWDLIKHTLDDLDDPEELADKEEEVRIRFKQIISEYLQSENKTDYENWTFEMSAKNAERRRIKNQPLDGTGFPELTKTLVKFLNSDRLKAELKTAVTTSIKTQDRVQKSIQRRIPLLGETLEKLEEKIKLVQPWFDKLTKIRDDFDKQINETKVNSAERISESFKISIKKLSKTFDSDFVDYEPELEGNSETEREKFLQALDNAFGSYLQDKISDWYKYEANPILQDAFLRLATSATMYVANYVQTTDKITQMLLEGCQTDVNFISNSNLAKEIGNVSGTTPEGIKDVPGVLGGIGGAFSGLMVGSSLGMAIGGALVGVFPHIGAGLLATGIFAPIGVLVLLGTAWGVEEARKDHYVSEAKKQLKAQIPKIAEEIAGLVRENIIESFSNSLKLVEKMDDDIKLQKEQLNNLLEQRKNNEVNIDKEKNRLVDLGNAVTNLTQKIVELYEQI